MTRLLLSAILLATLCGSLSGAELVLRDSAVARGPIVTLGDVVDLGPEATTEWASLSRTPIMPAPAPGTQTYLTKARIRDLLTARGVDVGDLRWTGSQTVAISALADDARDPAPAASQRVERRRPADALPVGTSIEDAVARSIQAFLAEQSGYDQWSVEFRMTSKIRQELAELGSAIHVGGGRTPWTGKQRFLLSGSPSNPADRSNSADGVRPIAVLASVARLEAAVVAVRPIQRGDLIRQSDVAVQMIDRQLPASAIRLTDDAVGQEAAQSIQEGAYLLDSQIKAPLMVRRGETVAVYARSGGVVAKTTAVARQDGSRGDLVEVEVAGTKQRLSGHVSGFRQLDVLAAGTAAVDYQADHSRQSLAR